METEIFAFVLIAAGFFFLGLVVSDWVNDYYDKKYEKFREELEREREKYGN